MKIQRRSTSLRYKVEDTLRQEIASGRLQPGERLVESRLCSALDVSRTSLREALRCLETEGLVVLQPYRGAIVASVAFEDARQIYQVRCALEVQAISNFVRAASDEGIGELTALMGEFVAQASDGLAGAELLEIKQRFYDTLLDIDESTILRGILQTLNNRVSLLRAISMARPGRLRSTLAELREIVSAIEARDEPRAVEATHRHIARAADNVLELLAERTDSE